MQFDDVHHTSFQGKSAKFVEELLVFLVSQKTTITSMNFRNPRIRVADIAIALKVLTISTKVTF